VDDLRTVVLVEGASDQVALQALAARRGRDLAAEGVGIVPMGGARSIGRFLELLGPRGLDLALAGLCDAREEDDFRRGLERAGLGSNLDRAAMASLGFHVCVADLEDELIRCLGPVAVERVIERQGELGPYRTFQRQPAQRARSLQDQLRRFIGTASGRKHRYARLLVDALDLSRVPEPLDRLLAHVGAARPGSGAAPRTPPPGRPAGSGR
jgi:hypothetical protein